MPTFIIAEAGVNHNGSLGLPGSSLIALQMLARTLWFQTFRAEQLVVQHAPKAEYQTRTTNATESQFEMIQRVTIADHEVLIAHARTRGLSFCRLRLMPKA